MSLCISWCISSFHSRPTTPSFVHPRTPTIIRPPLPPAPPPPYLQDLSSLFLPCWLTSPRPKECLTLGSGWIRAVPAPKHAQLFLMSSSRSGLWASWPAVIGTCLGGQCGCETGWKQSLAEGTVSPSHSNQQWGSEVVFDWLKLWQTLMLQMFKPAWCTNTQKW